MAMLVCVGNVQRLTSDAAILDARRHTGKLMDLEM